LAVVWQSKIGTNQLRGGLVIVLICKLLSDGVNLTVPMIFNEPRLAVISIHMTYMAHVKNLLFTVFPALWFRNWDPMFAASRRLLRGYQQA